MNHLMRTEDSYAERRLLFKNIWDTAMHIEEKDAEIMNKPKVIKTLRLDEVDRCGISKKKKLKLRNLRTVCNKILDFCDKQEADDIFYQKMNAEGQGPTHHTPEIKPKKVKNYRNKKKNKRSRSLFSPVKESSPARVTPLEKKEELITNLNKTRFTSPVIIKRATDGKTASAKASKSPRNLIESVSASPKVIQKSTKKKKQLQPGATD